MMMPRMRVLRVPILIKPRHERTELSKSRIVSSQLSSAYSAILPTDVQA